MPRAIRRCASRHGRQAFGADAAAAIAAKPFAHVELEAHPILGPGQIGEGALIVTMDAPRWRGAERTGRAGLGRLHGEGDLCRGVIDMPRLEAQQRSIG